MNSFNRLGFSYTLPSNWSLMVMTLPKCPFDRRFLVSDLWPTFKTTGPCVSYSFDSGSPTTGVLSSSSATGPYSLIVSRRWFLKLWVFDRCRSVVSLQKQGAAPGQEDVHSAMVPPNDHFIHTGAIRMLQCIPWASCWNLALFFLSQGRPWMVLYLREGRKFFCRNNLYSILLINRFLLKKKQALY